MIKWLKSLLMWLALKEQEEMEEQTEDVEEQKLGFIADKYESGEGKTDSGTISNIKGDPGGKSYGVYQMSAHAGTLQRYLQVSRYRAYFEGMLLATKEFDVQWMMIADEEQDEFAADQFEFIKKTHYLPAAAYAKLQGYDVDHRAVQEALFSISVQHKGYRSIIRRARLQYPTKTVKEQVDALYATRAEYVKGLKSLPDSIKAAVLNRYVLEKADVLDLV